MPRKYLFQSKIAVRIGHRCKGFGYLNPIEVESDLSICLYFFMEMLACCTGFIGSNKKRGYRNRRPAVFALPLNPLKGLAYQTIFRVWRLFTRIIWCFFSNSDIMWMTLTHSRSRNLYKLCLLQFFDRASSTVAHTST